MIAQEDNEPRSNSKNAAKSRLFWELKADQVLNRIFDQHQRNLSAKKSNAFTDVEILDFTTHTADKSRDKEQKIDWIARLSSKTWLTLTVVSLTTLLLATILLSSKQRYQLDQESNLRLLSLLRQQEAPEKTHESNTPENGDTTANPYPPAPPNEEWIEELSKLPQSGGNSSELLKVPLNGSSPSSLAISPATAGPKLFRNAESSLPKLVGVIQGAGTGGSAIFQWEGSSTSVNSGEAIGASNWRLRTVNGSSAIIERNGQQQRVTINTND